MTTPTRAATAKAPAAAKTKAPAKAEVAAARPAAKTKAPAKAKAAAKPTRDSAKATADVVDLVGQHPESYAAGRDPALVELGPAKFLALAGRGDPSGDAFQEAAGALYAVAYTIRFARQKLGRRTFKVPPLEGLWWGRSLLGDFTAEPRESWNWKILIRVPADVRPAELAQARDAANARGRDAARRVQLEPFQEGRCVQALHLGPFATERATIDRLCAFVGERGLGFAGRHHEVYLSDPRRTAPAKLRTILRVPVAPASAAASGGTGAAASGS